MKEKEKVVRPGGLELPTFWFVARRSIQLSYGRADTLFTFNSLTPFLARFQPRNFILQLQLRFSVHSVQLRAFETGMISRALPIDERFERCGGLATCRPIRFRRARKQILPVRLRLCAAQRGHSEILFRIGT